MKTKLKMCAGYDGNPHESYIYKNINGKKYCKSCTLKLQPPKSINKVSEKQKFKITLNKEQLLEDKKFYTEVWANRFFVPAKEGDGSTYYKAKEIRCENPACKKRLPDEPNIMFFHHILEKRKYPEYRHKMWNIAILCPECHSTYETYPESIPDVERRKKELLNRIKNNNEKSKSETGI